MAQLDSLKLLKHVKNRPKIYHKKYEQLRAKNKSIVKNCFDQIGKIMKKPGNQCLRKWRDLVKYYRSIMKQDINRTQAKWNLFESMHFFKDHVLIGYCSTDNKNNIGNSTAGNSGNGSGSIISDKNSVLRPSSVRDSFSEECSSLEFNKMQEDNNFRCDDDSLDRQWNLSKIFETEFLTPIKRTSWSNNFQQISQIGSNFNCTSNSNQLQLSQSQITSPNHQMQQEERQQQPQPPQQQQQPPLEEDADLVFFKTLLTDFRKINKKRQRIFKTSMLTTLYQLLDEEENENEANVLVATDVVTNPTQLSISVDDDCIIKIED